MNLKDFPAGVADRLEGDFAGFLGNVPSVPVFVPRFLSNRKNRIVIVRWRIKSDFKATFLFDWKCDA
jgi:hypothetical protein